jgi:hypothetical protein
MSHRALIAEEQQDNRFEAYYSRNGAENLQLLDELHESLNVHGRVDWESLTGTATPEMARRLSRAEGSRYRVERRDSGNIVEPRPVAVNVPLERLLAMRDLLDCEVLYVVADGDVEAYWLAWTYPDVIRPWREHITMNVYTPDEVPATPDGILEHIETSDPQRTIGDFERGWLSDDVVREVVSGGHRWLYEMCSVAGQEECGGDGGVSADHLIQTPNHWLVFHSDTSRTLVPRSYPFIIPIRVDSPAESEQVRQAAADTRFSVGAGLNAAENVTREDKVRAYTDALREILDAHIDDVAAEFIPGELGRVVDQYQQTCDWQAAGDVWGR